MYKVFILLFLSINLFSSSCLTYKEAIESGVKQNKVVMLVLVGKYCGWCNKLKKEVLADTEIKKRTDKELITVILNKYDYKYPEQFKTPIIPSTFFIDPHTQEEIISQIGYSNIENFTELLNEVKDMY